MPASAPPGHRVLRRPFVAPLRRWAALDRRHGNVFRAEAAAGERNRLLTALHYERFEARIQVRMLSGGTPVIRVHSQIVGHRETAESLTLLPAGAVQGGRPAGRFAADLPGRRKILPAAGARGGACQKAAHRLNVPAG